MMTLTPTLSLTVAPSESTLEEEKKGGKEKKEEKALGGKGEGGIKNVGV